MKIVLVSNFLNQHMLPICEALMNSNSVIKFTFIATTEQSSERRNLGFVDINKQYDFVVCAYESESEFKRSFKIIEESDVAIIADAPNEYVSARMQNDKLTFICSERYYKKGLWRILNPKTYFFIHERLLKYKTKENLFYLTIGAYMPYDLHLLGFSLNKCFQWAYFPMIQHDIIKEKVIGTSSKLKLLWVGRFIRVKHPDVALRVAYSLKNKNINFELVMIGTGEESSKIKRMIKKYQLSDVVHYKGACSPEIVQMYMSTSDVYLFTSDYWEGWGAVLNESMANSCIPIASKKAGATHVLIENGKNGFIYNSEKEIVGIIQKLLRDQDITEIALNSQKTIKGIWSAEVAASRIIDVSAAILERREIPSYMENTPMSKPKLRKARNYFGSNF